MQLIPINFPKENPHKQNRVKGKKVKKQLSGSDGSDEGFTGNENSES